MDREGYLRIGYANTPEVIAAGLDKMENILRSCRCKLCAAGIAGCFFRFVVSIYKNIQYSGVNLVAFCYCFHAFFCDIL